MKKILFDLYQAQPAGLSKFHGGGEYIKTVYKFLIDNDLDKCELIVFYDNQRYIDEWILKSFVEKNIKTEIIHSLDDINIIFEKYEIDIFYSGIPYHYGRVDIPTNVIKKGTVHGLRDIELPTDNYEMLYAHGLIRKMKSVMKTKIRYKIVQKNIRRFRACLEYLDEIVCVSNHTKFAIQNFYPDIKKPINVFYTPAKYIKNDDRNTPLVLGKYILLLGLNRFEKNGFRALHAIDDLISKNLLQDYIVVTVGEIPNMVKRKIVNIDKIKSFNYLETKDLENLYQYCDIFLYPSLNEGFGMPPLEAMKYGRTCIVSAVCSLPEICGDSVYYINPYDESEIKNRILMAKEIKISEKRIKEHLDIIRNKQDIDLEEMCNFIIT